MNETIKNRLAVFQILLLLTLVCSPPLIGQNPVRDKSSVPVALTLAVKRAIVDGSGTEMAILTLKNVTSEEVPLYPFLHCYRAYVSSERGEPPLTVYHRHRRGIYLPGDPPDLPFGGPIFGIPPGASEQREIDLSKFYDLRTPGRYTLYMEYEYEPTKWIRTKTVAFEVEATPKAGEVSASEKGRTGN